MNEIAAAITATDMVGIQDLSNEAYHSGPGISKSGLWTIHKKTPEHFIGQVRKESAAMQFGTACHTALLEPENLEKCYSVLPANAPRKPDSRQINAKNPSPETVAAIGWWQEWNAFNAGKVTITAEDWQSIQTVRDKLHQDPLIQKLVKGAQYEKSAYWIDEETGELCRVRPDIYSPTLRMLGDLKTCRDAREFQFAKSIEDFGYHVQDAFYSDGWQQAGGGEVDAFVFIAVESEAPFAFQIYELDPYDKAEGRAIYQQALRRYADCKRTGLWPGYGGGVRTIARPKWARGQVEVADFDE